MDINGFRYKEEVLKKFPDAWIGIGTPYEIFASRAIGSSRLALHHDEDEAWRQAYMRCFGPVAPSSVAPESGEEFAELRNKAVLGEIALGLIKGIGFDDMTDWQEFCLAASPEVIIDLIDKYNKLRSDLLSQLKRDDQRYENWKKIQKS